MQIFGIQMRNGICLILIYSQMLVSQAVRAQEQSNPCQEIIKAADQAIKSREELIDLQVHRIDDLQDQNTKLSDAVVSLHEESLKSSNDNYLYGILGIVVGGAAVAFIKK